MSPTETPAPLSPSILEEAAGWFIDFNDGELDNSGRERLHQWLRRSPEHVRAYLEVAAAWEDAARIGGGQRFDHAALIAKALSETNVVVFSAPSLGGREERRPAEAVRAPSQRYRQVLYAAIAASIVAIALLLVRWMDRNTYSTAVGEQRSLILADGSTVELNARSRLHVDFSPGERTVELLEGQALFRVKKNTARPFVVVSSGTRVRAVGTQFDVYRKRAGTVVTVIEGRVAVTSPPNRSQPTVAADSASNAAARERPLQSTEQNPSGSSTSEVPVLLSAGEQLTVSGAAAAQPVAANVAAALAWTQRKLVFDETPLQEAVTEFNRYNTRQIVLDDPDLAVYHIRGTFDSEDPERLIQFLRERFNANVTESSNEIRISRAK